VRRCAGIEAARILGADWMLAVQSPAAGRLLRVPRFSTLLAGRIRISADSLSLLALRVEPCAHGRICDRQPAGHATLT